MKTLISLKKPWVWKKKCFNTNFSKLKNESLELKQEIESLLDENSKLLEKLKQAESDLTTTRRWNSSSRTLNCLNTHHNRTKKRLGFVTKRTVYPVNRKYVGYLKVLSVFIVIKRVIIDILVP